MTFDELDKQIRSMYANVDLNIGNVMQTVENLAGLINTKITMYDVEICIKEFEFFFFVFRRRYCTTVPHTQKFKFDGKDGIYLIPEVSKLIEGAFEHIELYSRLKSPDKFISKIDKVSLRVRGSDKWSKVNVAEVKNTLERFVGFRMLKGD